MSNQERMPFGGDEVAAAPKKTLKINNNNSKFVKKVEDKQIFENEASEVIERKKQRNKKTVELASQFINFIKDKTLTQNKSSLAKTVEKEICDKLINLCLEVNNDDTEPEGMGATALINLLMKTTLMQRDLINELDFEVAVLKKQVSSLSPK